MTPPTTICARAVDLLPPPFEWCEIPAGKVTLEKGGYVPEGGQTFDVPAFVIAKYPVTNAQFAKFIEAKGYGNKLWWTDVGWQAKEPDITWDPDLRVMKPTNKPWTEPHYWTDSECNNEDCPVVGISWYEAAAFCSWLSFASGETILLPTEQQWQRTAQGDDGRTYPWGNEFDPERCNTNESRIEHITPVTQYPDGASPYNVMDMVGNVWEWCLTGWNDANSNIVGDDQRVVRGGSWLVDQLLAQATNRLNNLPYLRYSGIGFRLACRNPYS